MKPLELFQALRPYMRTDIGIAVTEDTSTGEIMGVAVVLPPVHPITDPAHGHIVSTGVPVLNPEDSNEPLVWHCHDGCPTYRMEDRLANGEGTGHYKSYWLQQPGKPSPNFAQLLADDPAAQQRWRDYVRRGGKIGPA
jgi:hypothetical protein